MEQIKTTIKPKSKRCGFCEQDIGCYSGRYTQAFQHLNASSDFANAEMVKNAYFGIKEKQYNGYLKQIPTLCNVSKYVTSHTALHTFATTFILENDIPIER